MCICYGQSSDWDSPWIVLCKPWVQALLNHSMDYPCARCHNTRCTCSYVYADRMVAHRNVLDWMLDEKTFLFTKKARDKVPRRSQAEEMNFFLSGANIAEHQIHSVHVHNSVLLIKVSMMSSQHDPALLFLVQLKPILVLVFHQIHRNSAICYV